MHLTRKIFLLQSEWSCILKRRWVAWREREMELEKRVEKGEFYMKNEENFQVLLC